MTGTLPDAPGSATTAIVLVQDPELLRQALVAVLARESDLQVVAALSAGADPVEVARNQQPDVVLVDGCRAPEGWEVAHRLASEIPGVRLLVLSEASRTADLRRALTAGVAGLVSADVSPEQLVAAVRRVAVGERVVEPALGAAALQSSSGSLTGREQAVLRLAADGLSVSEIAARLYVSTGTVRNHLSSAIRKTGARNRLEAARRAQQHGWL